MLNFILENEIALLFSVITIGLFLGRMQFKGINVGIAGVLLVGLLAGHLGGTMSEIVQSIGLVFFVTAVGLIAGRDFKQTFLLFGKSYFIIAFSTLGISLLVTLVLAQQIGLEPGLAAGMMTGALTSTPGLGAALEAAGGDPMVGVGYAIAYPLGVLGVVGGVNLVVSFRSREHVGNTIGNYPTDNKEKSQKLAKGDALSLAGIMITGILIGQIPIPLPWIGFMTLGLAGGPLLTAIFVGHLGQLGPLTANFPNSSLNLLRDLGAVFVLAAVGISAGQQFWDLLLKHGLGLLLGGFFITMIAVLVAVLLSVYILKLNYINTTGALSGVMTSTPGLAAALDSVGTDEPAVAYTAIYPLAIIINSIIANILVVILT